MQFLTILAMLGVAAASKPGRWSQRVTELETRIPHECEYATLKCTRTGTECVDVCGEHWECDQESFDEATGTSHCQIINGGMIVTDRARA